MSNESLTYESLREQGMQSIESLSSHIWTDYNIHDPGLTQLEHLCFGLADLAYRLAHPIENLLAQPGPQPPHADFTAETILPCRSLTLLDYRKLLIDLPLVRNAWLDKVPYTDPIIYVDCDAEALTFDEDKAEARIQPRGFYQVWLDLEDDVLPADEPAVLAEALALMQAHRNLCEVVLAVDKVKREDVGVCAEIEVEPAADLARVHAAIVYALETFIAPVPAFYTLAERRALGLSAEEVLEGPYLEHGFLDDDEVRGSERYAQLHVSDLIQLMMDVDGVLAVKNVSVSSYRDGQRIQAGERWVLPLDPRRSARLGQVVAVNGEDRQVTRLLFYKSGVPFVADGAAVAALLVEHRAADRHSRDIQNDAHYEVPSGTWPDPAAYFSLQNLFPSNYGIGEAGLPASASVERKAQARQLKAYLLLFEQFLANAQAQVAGLRDLFSLADVDRTFHTQLTRDVADFQQLLRHSEAETAEHLHRIGETQAQFFKRRHRFLNHLLARFGERFEEYALITRRLHGARADRQLMRDKMRFLNAYPVLSSQRGAAGDITRTNDAGSGLEQYLRVLLGTLDDFFEVYFNRSENKYRWRLQATDGQMLLYGTKPYPDRAAAEIAVAQVSAQMHDPVQYDINQTQGGKWYAFLVVDGKNLARVPGNLDNQQLLNDHLNLIATFAADHPPSEHMVLIEHILLRPRAGTNAFLPTCVNTQAGECCGDDPYSFRVSVYLPYWMVHFRNMAFRGFIERTVRARLPAHIFPKICWIGRDEMIDLKAKYGAWRQALALRHELNLDALPDDAGEVNLRDAALADAQDALIDCMQQLRSRFPETTLHDCVEGDDENPTVLGHAMLGTFKPDEP